MYRFGQSQILPLFVLAISASSLIRAEPPTIYDNAPDFELSTVEGKAVRLST
jgi:hypothetical protein